MKHAWLLLCLAAIPCLQAAESELAARGHRSIAIDLPGYGLSARPRDPPKIADYADAMAAVLRPDFGYRRLQGSSSNMAFDEPVIWVEGVTAAAQSCAR